MNTEMNVIPFEFTDTHTVRTVVFGDDIWFIAKDVAVALGYSNYRQAVIDHCKYAKSLIDIGVVNHDPSTAHTKVIPESDVYRLINRSRLPSAERFQDWVCDEVLPSLRKHKTYTMSGHTPLTPLTEGLVKVFQGLETQIKLLDDKMERVEKRLAEVIKFPITTETMYTCRKYYIKRVGRVDEDKLKKLALRTGSLARRQGFKATKINDPQSPWPNQVAEYPEQIIKDAYYQLWGK